LVVVVDAGAVEEVLEAVGIEAAVEIAPDVVFDAGAVEVLDAGVDVEAGVAVELEVAADAALAGWMPVMSESA
jgi:hypothetical protein